MALRLKTSTTTTQVLEAAIDRSTLPTSLQMLSFALEDQGVLFTTESSLVRNLFEARMEGIYSMGQPERADLIVDVSVIRKTQQAHDTQGQLVDIIFTFVGHPSAAPSQLLMESTRATVPESGLYNFFRGLLRDMLPKEVVTKEMINQTVQELKQRSQFGKALTTSQTPANGCHGYMREVGGGTAQYDLGLKTKVKCEMESEVKIVWPDHGFIVGLISATLGAQGWDVRCASIKNVGMLDPWVLKDGSTARRAQEDLKQKLHVLG